MRVFLSVLILIFSFQSLSNADDISEFEIEGISVGDSLLDYFSENQIKKESWPWHKDDDTFRMFSPTKNYNYYEYVMFSFLGEDKNYIIQEVAGRKNMNIEYCKKVQLEFINDIEELIPDSKKDNLTTDEYRGDKSKKSKKTYINFYSGDGFIHIGCYDFSEKFSKENNYDDGINVSVGSKKFLDFQRSGAF